MGTKRLEEQLKLAKWSMASYENFIHDDFYPRVGDFLRSDETALSMVWTRSVDLKVQPNSVCGIFILTDQRLLLLNCDSEAPENIDTINVALADIKHIAMEPSNFNHGAFRLNLVYQTSIVTAETIDEMSARHFVTKTEEIINNPHLVLEEADVNDGVTMSSALEHEEQVTTNFKTFGADNTARHGTVRTTKQVNLEMGRDKDETAFAVTKHSRSATMALAIVGFFSLLDVIVLAVENGYLHGELLNNGKLVAPGVFAGLFGLFALAFALLYTRSTHLAGEPGLTVVGMSLVALTLLASIFGFVVIDLVNAHHFAALTLGLALGSVSVSAITMLKGIFDARRRSEV